MQLVVLVQVPNTRCIGSALSIFLPAVWEFHLRGHGLTLDICSSDIPTFETWTIGGRGADRTCVVPDYRPFSVYLVLFMWANMHALLCWQFEAAEEIRALNDRSWGSLSYARTWVIPQPGILAGGLTATSNADTRVEGGIWCKCGNRSSKRLWRLLIPVPECSHSTSSTSFLSSPIQFYSFNGRIQ